MSLLYTIAMPAPCGRPPVSDQPEHIRLRARAQGMRDAGKTRREIAERLGVSERTLRRWGRMDAPGDPIGPAS